MLVRVKEHKVGKRKYGYFIEQENGLKIYLARRSLGQIWREKELSLSEAVRSGKARWAIDVNTLAEAKRWGCTVIGVRDRVLGRYYFTSITNFYNPKHAKLIDYSSKGGGLQRTLPITAFKQIGYNIRL